MGVSLAWIVMSGKERDTILDDLGLERTGEYGEFCDFALADRKGQGSAYIVTAMIHDHDIVADATLRSLSRDCQIVAGSVEEYVMDSRTLGAWRQSWITRQSTGASTRRRVFWCGWSFRDVPSGSTSHYQKSFSPPSIAMPRGPVVRDQACWPRRCGNACARGHDETERGWHRITPPAAAAPPETV